MFRAANPAQDLSVAKSYSERNIWILSVTQKNSHNGKNAKPLILVQLLCFVLCGYKCLVTHGKQAYR